MDTTIILGVLGAGSVLAVLLWQVRQVLDQIPEVVASWRRARQAVQRLTDEDC